MGLSSVLVCLVLVGVAPVSVASQPGFIENLILATHQRPWLWSIYVFTVGLPIILFISFMWPDLRFGPPDEQYYYKKSDDVQPDDPEIPQEAQTADNNGRTGRPVTRRRDTQTSLKKSELAFKG
ncbi:calnexin-like [Lampris incognitus]|uniref:calnexin-like n=1 Tax=Lampris incognitus TaxID=2546036 RepID=UPI0024B492EF|nr:calnexin-like [Lampris incognitus]XP_056151033.1 calnexin-like [Lampris incognitus]